MRLAGLRLKAKPPVMTLGACLTCGLLLASGSVPAQSIGRLFSTIEERIRLDQLRADYVPGQAKVEPAPRAVADPEPSPPAVPRITVNGLVLRSSGRNASWINGNRLLEGQPSAEGIRAKTGRTAQGGVRLILPSGRDTKPLKPGQRIDVTSGTIVEMMDADRDGKAGTVSERRRIVAEDVSAFDAAPRARETTPQR